MPHIEQQFQIKGVAEFVTKAQHLHPHWATFAVGTEPLQDVAAERVYRVVRAIDNLIRFGADARHGSALGADCLQQALSVRGRVWPARFAESMLQDFVGCFQKKNKNTEPGGPERCQLFSKVSQEGPFTDINYERSTSDPFLA